MAIVTDGLVLYLHGACGKNNPATRVWKDLSGNGNDGELVNFGYIEDSGWVDGGLKFDGVDDYVECQNIFNVDYDSTYEVVVNLKRNTGTYMNILVRRYHWGDSIFVSGNQLRFYLMLEDGSSIYLNTSNIIKYDGEILHITRVFKDGDFYMYINGELKSKTEKGVKGIPANDIRNSPYRISHPDFPIDGDIKLVRIYNRALTDEEILQNYQAGHEWTPQIGKREVTTTMKPITTSLSRKGKGKRELISTMKPITTSLERKGVGKREVITTMKPITSELNRKGVGRREVITTMQPITSSISKKLPPIHADIDIKERIPELEVD